MSQSQLDWEAAKARLDKIKRQYKGNVGSGAVDQARNDAALANLEDLEKRYAASERSQSLYDAMMAPDPSSVSAAAKVKKGKGKNGE